MFEAIGNFFKLIGSVITSIIHFLGYIPDLFRMVTSGSETMLAMMNYLPPLLTAVGVVVIAYSIIMLILEIVK